MYIINLYIYNINHLNSLNSVRTGPLQVTFSPLPTSPAKSFSIGTQASPPRTTPCPSRSVTGSPWRPHWCRWLCWTRRATDRGETQLQRCCWKWARKAAQSSDAHTWPTRWVRRDACWVKTDSYGSDLLTYGGINEEVKPILFPIAGLCHKLPMKHIYFECFGEALWGGRTDGEAWEPLCFYWYQDNTSPDDQIHIQLVSVPMYGILTRIDSPQEPQELREYSSFTQEDVNLQRIR